MASCSPIFQTDRFAFVSGGPGGLDEAVNPMALPQTVAAFHALVGAAAVA